MCVHGLMMCVCVHGWMMCVCVHGWMMCLCAWVDDVFVWVDDCVGG